jgi:hypothetical protein
VNQAGSGAYSNQSTYEIDVDTTLATLADVPEYELDARLSRALSDVKRLIPLNQSLNGCANIVKYVGSKRDFYSNGDAIQPGKMVVTIKVYYTQDRSNPETN